MREISSSVVDGVLECRFTRPISVSRFINQNFVDFNLSANEYYVLQASGGVISFAGIKVRFNKIFIYFVKIL